MTDSAAKRRWFGAVPTKRMPIYVSNSLCLLGGAALLADNFLHFAGIVLIGEAFLQTIEQCWPKAERPE